MHPGSTGAPFGTSQSSEGSEAVERNFSVTSMSSCHTQVAPARARGRRCFLSSFGFCHCGSVTSAPEPDDCSKDTKITKHKSPIVTDGHSDLVFHHHRAAADSSGQKAWNDTMIFAAKGDSIEA